MPDDRIRDGGTAGPGGRDRTSGDVGEIFLGLDMILTRLRGLEGLSAGALERGERERLVRLLEDLLVEAKRVLEYFGTRCSFCRTAPADLVGTCAQCGQDACTNCAGAYNGVILHRGSCAAFYDGTSRT